MVFMLVEGSGIFFFCGLARVDALILCGWMVGWEVLIID
jgi:hypothetical protein